MAKSERRDLILFFRKICRNLKTKEEYEHQGETEYENKSPWINKDQRI